MKNSLMSIADKILLRKRALIETVNDELKNIEQREKSLPLIRITPIQRKAKMTLKMIHLNTSLTTMKTLRLIGTTLLMVMLAVNFTACSDDEDEQTIIEQANLIGKWQTTWEKIHKVENDKEVVTSDEAYTNGLWEFKADGTCTEGYADGGYTETSRWSLKDNKLTISYDDGYSDVLTVNELTATKLVLAFEDWDTMDDGSEELDDITTTTYKKID